MTLYLTSTNPDKINASTQLLTLFNLTRIESVKSESGIEGGQPYGLDETKMGCINRTKQFTNNENFISIENGFVKQYDTNWYDIAYIYIRINNIYYSGWSDKRTFPKKIYRETNKSLRNIFYITIRTIKQWCQDFGHLGSFIIYKIDLYIIFISLVK
jgi:non-canonical (house-cleaning) NTP pyrophosphatase